MCHRRDWLTVKERERESLGENISKANQIRMRGVND